MISCACWIVVLCNVFKLPNTGLSTLIGEKGLVDEVLASDLNSKAVELLFENLQRWDKRKYPKKSEYLKNYYTDRIIGLADATKLSKSIPGAPKRGHFRGPGTPRGPYKTGSA